jgi:hypothetical protein
VVAAARVAVVVEWEAVADARVVEAEAKAAVDKVEAGAVDVPAAVVDKAVVVEEAVAPVVVAARVAEEWEEAVRAVVVVDARAAVAAEVANSILSRRGAAV